MSYAPEVLIEGKWSRNGLRFSSKDEAEATARDTMARRIMVEHTRVVESSDPVNAALIDGKLELFETDARRVK